MDKLDKDIKRILGTGYKPIVKFGPIDKKKQKNIKKLKLNLKLEFIINQVNNGIINIHRIKSIYS